MEKENSTENYESSLVRKFVDDLNKGQSFLQASNQKPDYVLNASTNEVFQGINMIIVGQAMRDNNKVSAQALTLNQRDSLDYMSAPGTKHIATAIYDKYDAWWRKNDPEVIAGKEVAGTHKKNADGTYVKDKIFKFLQVPYEEIQDPLKRTNPFSIESIVTNYDDVVGYLKKKLIGKEKDSLFAEIITK